MRIVARWYRLYNFYCKYGEANCIKDAIHKNCILTLCEYNINWLISVYFDSILNEIVKFDNEICIQFSAKPKALLDDATSSLLSNNEIKYKHHPGVIMPRTPEFPQWALKEIHTILKGISITYSFYSTKILQNI